MSQAATAGSAPRVAEAPVRGRRISRALLRPILMLGGILVVAVASGAYWLTGGRYVSIDDAYVRAAKETISTDVSGIVASVPVHEGQRVKKGDVLLRLDPLQFQIMLDAATRESERHRDRRERHEARLSAHAARRRREAGAGAVRSGELRALLPTW